MNLVNIVKPAINSFLFVVMLALGAQAITSTVNSFEGQGSNEGVVVSTTPSPTPKVAAKKATATKSTSSSKTTTPKTVTRAPAPKPVATCIVTINGSKYNVQSLRKTHSGGDIFKCGTDMTAIYKTMHGTNYGLISKYKI